MTQYEGMSAEEARLIRQELTSKLEEINYYIANVTSSTCQVCSTVGHGRFALPGGWGYAGKYVVCSVCGDKWNKVSDTKVISEEELLL